MDDIPNPFGDSRDCLVASLWLIDIDNGFLSLLKKNRKLGTQLSVIKDRVVSTEDLISFDLPPLQRSIITVDFPTPTWEPECDNVEQRLTFTSRLLQDFSHQWRHVLRGQYNNSTFRRLARAIINIVTSDFTVKEIASSRAGVPGPIVWLRNLPQWDPVARYTIYFNRVTAVFCQNICYAQAMIQADLGHRRAYSHQLRDSASFETPCEDITYVVVSVREVFLYKACLGDLHPPIYTRPEPLLNGVNIPSTEAIQYLLLMTDPPNHGSRLHKLPIEVQDIILANLSRGPLESARLGCILSLGSTFTWQCFGNPVRLQNVLVTRAWAYPVESQIWFGDHISGLVYK